MKRYTFFATILLIFSLFPSTRGQDTIRMLSFNIWQEGTQVTNGLEKIRDVILAVDPDVVCFAEVRNYSGDWTTKILEALSAEGKNYHGHFYGGDVSLISKYPILSGEVVYNGNGSVVNYRLEAPSTEIVVGCAHLDYTYYACYLPRGYNGGDPDWSMIDDGTGNPDPVTDVNEILTYDLKSKRDEQVAAFLDAVSDDTVPVFLMGDFNEPSWLDWTEKTDTMFDHHGVVIEWPVTKDLDDGGFLDAFRTFYPDEARNPGITWPSYATDKGSTSWTPKADERDRIDFIFFRGDRLEVVDAALVGPRESYAYNVVDTTCTSHEKFLAADLPWPSDHKAVYAAVRIDTTDTTTYAAIPPDVPAFTITPNPAENELHLVLSRPASQAEVEVFSVDGQRLRTFRLGEGQNFTLSVEGLPRGVHLLRIQDREKILGTRTVVFR